jgi:hypothetical protein
MNSLRWYVYFSFQSLVIQLLCVDFVLTIANIGQIVSYGTIQQQYTVQW